MLANVVTETFVCAPKADQTIAGTEGVLPHTRSMDIAILTAISSNAVNGIEFVEGFVANPAVGFGFS